MGESKNRGLKLHFDGHLRVEFKGAKVTTDAGLLAVRELDEALGLRAPGPYPVPGCGSDLRGKGSVHMRAWMTVSPLLMPEGSPSAGAQAARALKRRQADEILVRKRAQGVYYDGAGGRDEKYRMQFLAHRASTKQPVCREVSAA